MLPSVACPFAWMIAFAVAMPAARSQGTPDYRRDVAPILERCYECHGPVKQRKSLRLDSRSSILAGGRAGPAVIPCHSADSPLIQRVLGTGNKKRMPPNGPPLSEAEVDVLRAWIDVGAHGPADGTQHSDLHWAYAPRTRPAAPAVAQRNWPRSGLDLFTLARLEAAGLEPSPQADRAIWLRRASLDLIGLPPTPEEVDAFVANTDADAYETAVDMMLASPRYGEHQARMWLDLARYADTQGFEKDSRRSIWLYRDWVIKALNADMPFDQFTIEQLAGDLLPSPSSDQLVATAFHRNTMTNDEGGTDNEEFRVEAVSDRIETTMQVWMGTTMACARCHDHKFDPFSQREYFELFAFFNNTEDNDFSDDRPKLDLFTPEQQAERERLFAVESHLQAMLDGPLPELEASQARWDQDSRARVTAFRANPPRPGPWSLADPFQVESRTKGFARVFAPEPGAEGDAELDWVEHPEWVDGKVHNGLPGLNVAHYLRRTITCDEPLTATLALGMDDSMKVWLNGQKVFERDRESVAKPNDELATVSLREGENHLLMKIVNGLGPSGFFFNTRAVELPEDLVDSLMVSRQDRTPQQQAALTKVYRERLPELAAVRNAIGVVKVQIRMVTAPTVPVMRELAKDKSRVTSVHVRGNFLEHGDRVEADVPDVFPALPEKAGRDRLTLANWLVSPDNPLTARVVVNRHWERLFGRGLVETSEDFGTQGEPPSHPKLLDWLASELIDRDWSLKQLLREIVLSSTYRQSSGFLAKGHDVDPQNVLLWRGPRFRLPAETIRDQSLAIGGLLSSTMYGPSVMPPQPEGLWRNVYSADRWATQIGDNRYRRGLYTFWRRTVPYPSFSTFDAPSREYCVMRRMRTNTPLQSLVTLNDPAHAEAARALAARMMREAAGTRDRAERGFRLCVARRPAPAETNRLLRLHRQALQHYQAAPQAAKELAATRPADRVQGLDAIDLAAWTAVASVLLNLDEVLTKP